MLRVLGSKALASGNLRLHFQLTRRAGGQHKRQTTHGIGGIGDTPWNRGQTTFSRQTRIAFPHRHCFHHASYHAKSEPLHSRYSFSCRPPTLEATSLLSEYREFLQYCFESFKTN